jgi:AcrR family transcriptional regulator
MNERSFMEVSMIQAANPQPAPLLPSEKRSAEILDKVKVAFAEKGFDGASMQDLARAAGMSVGNFYRYFPSKASIVEGLVAVDLADMENDFIEVFSAPNPMQRLRALIHQRIPMHRENHDGRLWAEITAVALRKPEIAASACKMESCVSRSLTAVFSLHTGLSMPEAEARFATQASFIVLLIKSAAMIGPHNCVDHDALCAMVINTIDQTLNEISSFRPKG